MGWERRGRKRYFYSKARDGAKVRSQYFGNEVDAHLVAADVAHEGHLRAKARESARVRREAERLVEGLMAGLERDVRTLMGAALLFVGYRSHRGQWRLVRNANKKNA